MEGLAVERVHGDVTRPETLRPAFEGAEAIIHLAGLISIRGDMGGRVPAINVRGARNVAEVALQTGVRRMIHCSSIHAFCQDPLHEPLDEARAKVHGQNHPAYDRSKAAGELEVLRVVERGLDAVIVNPTGIIGPHDYQPSRMGRVLLSVVRRRLPALIGGGFDWVDVRDVVAGILAAEARGKTGENYLLGGTWRSMEALVSDIARIASVRPPRWTVPMWLARAGAPVADAFGHLTKREPLYTRESLSILRANAPVSTDKARGELGYRPRPLEATLKDTYAWFMEREAPEPRRAHPPDQTSGAC
jgi:dihydroflavonol-4-reductase